jgi:hypothetical protein
MAELPSPPEGIVLPTSSSQTMSSALGASTPKYSAAGWPSPETRFTVLKGVIHEIANPLTGKLVVVPSNPLTVDAQDNVSRVLPEGQSSGEVVAG